MKTSQHLIKVLGLAVAIGLCSSAMASSADYMIPRGLYLTEDLMLKVTKVKRELTTDENGRQILYVRYRLPAVIEGENAKTIQLHGDFIVEGKSTLTSKEGHVANCFEDVESGPKCEIDYAKNKVLSPDVSIFEIDRSAGEEFVNSQPFTQEQAKVFSMARTSLEHEARGVVLFKAQN